MQSHFAATMQYFNMLHQNHKASINNKLVVVVAVAVVVEPIGISTLMQSKFVRLYKRRGDIDQEHFVFYMGHVRYALLVFIFRLFPASLLCIHV